MRFCMSKILFSILLGTLFISTSMFAQQPDEPRLISIDVPGAGKGAGVLNCGNGLIPYCPGTFPLDINKEGEIVGLYLTDPGVYYGFLRYADGKYVSFSAPGADTAEGDFNGTYPQSINSSGAVTGIFQGSDEVFHGFVREPNGSFVIINLKEAGTAAYQGTFPTSINDRGQVAGVYFDSSNGEHGFLRNCDGSVITFDDPNANAGTMVALEEALNSGGAIIGWYNVGNVAYGFLREPDGLFKTIEPDTSSPFTVVGGINRTSSATGYFADTSGVLHGFLRKPSGSTAIFDVPGPEAVGGTAAFTLNASDEITGVYVDSNNANHGFVRFPDGAFRTFDAPNIGTASSQGTRPTTINDAGEVIGFYLDSNNTARGFLRSPDKCDR